MKIFELRKNLTKTSGATDDFFMSWLRKNPNIKNKLKEPEVYDTLLNLPVIIGQLESLDKGSLIKYMLEHGKVMNSKGISVLIAMGQISDPSISEMLAPYRNLINMFSDMSMDVMVNTDAIRNDLLTISYDYSQERTKSIDEPYDELAIKKKRDTKKDKSRKLFISMLAESTKNVRNAVENLASNDNIVPFLTSSDISYQTIISALDRGVLANPKELAKIFPININLSVMNEAADITNSMKYGDDASEFNFEILKRGAMKAAGIHDFSEVSTSPLEDYEFDISPLVGMSESADAPSLSARFNIYPTQDEQWLDKGVLSVLSHVLYILFRIGWR